MQNFSRRGAEFAEVMQVVSFVSASSASLRAIFAILSISLLGLLVQLRLRILGAPGVPVALDTVDPLEFFAA